VTATREPGRYVPRPGDLPCVGRRVHLQLNVRRFFCDNPGCQQRTFVKRLPGVVSSFARRTARLAKAQRQIGLALGGEAVTGGRDMAFASRSCAARWSISPRRHLRVALVLLTTKPISETGAESAEIGAPLIQFFGWHQVSSHLAFPLMCPPKGSP